jgi:hypothetical protein
MLPSLETLGGTREGSALEVLYEPFFDVLRMRAVVRLVRVHKTERAHHERARPMFIQRLYRP